MRRTPLLLLVALGCPVVGITAWLASHSKADIARPRPAEPVAADTVPLTRILMFNTGVAHFEREGTVEGSPRVDLSFPPSDVNDLLKSMTIDDGGKPGIVSYDGTDPSENLSNFATNLSANPTFGQLLNQARGEKVEVSLEGGASGNGPFTGVIVGMEASQEPTGKEVHQLNLLTADGVRRLPLDRVARFRFLNAAFEEDFRRGLTGLTESQNAQRRSISLHLRGDGKRKLKIGYVVDNPIWKSSYRLALEGKDGKPHLQGWAVVQNTTEEDWKDVRVVLVSGRPVSFTMDLSQTLFMPRPSVTPEVYTSLQPQSHAPAASPVGPAPPRMQGGFQGGGGFQLGNAGAERNDQGERAAGVSPNPFGSFNRYQMDFGSRRPRPARLSYQELMKRRNAAVNARATATRVANDPALESIAVNAGTIGEGFRLMVDRPVSLPRQRSAMLPVQYGPIALTPVSLYNRATHPHFPLQGAKIKNTTGQHLLSGPATVTDSDGYVGDCKMPNLQPNEERYISFAMDLGLEITPEKGQPVTEYGPVRIQNKNLIRLCTTRLETKYRLNNRSPKRRTLLLDHVPESGWALVGKNRPVETARGVHRFEWMLDPERVIEEVVAEQTKGDETTSLSNLTPLFLEEYAKLDTTSKPVREALFEVIKFRRRINAASTEVGKEASRSQEILVEQTRLRTNIYHLPAGNAAAKRLLGDFDKLEDELHKVREAWRVKAAALASIEKELAAFVEKLDLK